MGHPTNLRSIPRDQTYGGTAERSVSSCIRQGTKLRDMLMSEKPNLSYAHFHHEITRDPKDALPKRFGNQQGQVSDRMTLKEDEVVRYMSNLPNYLEKGKNFQEKALNVGVIDWKRLEKWQYSQKQMPHKYSGYSPSSSNTSVSSTDGSSSHSSRGQRQSPARQRMPSFSLQSQVEASKKERQVQDAKSSAIRGPNYSPSHQRTHHSMLQSHSQKVYAMGGKSEEIGIFGGNTRGSMESIGGAANNLSRQPKGMGTFQEGERKGTELKSLSGMVRRPNSDFYDVGASLKGKLKLQGSEPAKETPRSRETKSNAAYRDQTKREKLGFTIKPEDQMEYNNVEDLSPSRNENKHLQSTGYCYVKNSSQASDLHHTKMLHSPSKISSQGVKAPSQASYLLPFPARRFSSPSRSRSTEEKKPIAGLMVVSAAKSLEELDVRKSSESIPKTRNPSPIRRLSFAVSKMIKNAGSRESSPLRRSSSTDSVAKSLPEGAKASLSSDNPGSERSSSNSRGRSSPLRRLFDPLLKSRGSNSPERSKKHSSSAVDTMKIKPRCSTHSTTSSFDAHPNPKNGSSSLQALLQVSFKNGLPLFTFAIDNESNILAATVRKSYVPGKGHYTWTYTFFTVREIKRKSGIWLNNQGGKGDGHGYVPNVVAQMKVSDSQGSPFTKHENADNNKITRDFDLFAVDIGHGDQNATDFHPTNELAAIVVKLPRSTSGNPSKDGQSTYSWLDLSHAFLREKLPEMKYSADTLQNHQYLQSSNFSTTVILPGGVHTVPSRGEISTLAQRWRSGGSCDCGGWDLGCQLRVYASQIGYERKMGSSATMSLDEHKFQLFSQVGQDNQLMLSLAPFKERICAVEFSSSLSPLQAFSICISFIDSRRPAELSGPSIVNVEKINNEVGVFEGSDQMKTSNHQLEVPPRYVSYPPHSPVGRV